MRFNAVLATATLLVTCVAAPATARTPGTNGQIAYDLHDEIVVVSNPDGSALQQVTPPDVPGCCPGWSPDGTKLAMAGSTQDGRVGTAVVNADGSDYHVLPILVPNLNLVCNVWSPSADRLACQGWNDDDPSLNGVYTVRSDGLDVRRLTNGFDFASDYSPDGKRILFEHEDNTLPRVTHSLVTIKTDGTDPRQVTAQGTVQGYTGSSWSPDGQWILFGGKARLWLVHPDGTALRQIPLDTDDSRYWAFAPSWSPDDSHLVFAMFVPNHNSDIYTAAADGSDVVQVTDTPDEEANPSWGTHPVQP